MPLTARDLKLIRDDRRKDLETFRKKFKEEIRKDRRQDLINFVTRPEFEELKLEMRAGFDDIRERLTIMQDALIRTNRFIDNYAPFNDARVNNLEDRVAVLERD